MKYIPIGNKVLISPERKPEVTASGIIVVEDKKKREPPSTGTVVALGPRCAVDFEVGMRVLFSRYDFDIIKVEDEEYSLGLDDDILGVLG